MMCGWRHRRPASASCGVSGRGRSRRTLLKAGVVSAAGIAVAGATFGVGLPMAARAAATKHTATIKPLTAIGDILSIARTAEELAVTFYSNGITHHHALGINDSDLLYLTGGRYRGAYSPRLSAGQRRRVTRQHL